MMTQEVRSVSSSAEMCASTSAVGRGDGDGIVGDRQYPSLLDLVNRLGEQFQPLDRDNNGGEVGSSAWVAQQEVDQEDVRRKWRARARKVSMGVILAVGQKLASRAATTDSKNEEDSEKDDDAESEIIQDDLLSIRLKLAKLDKENRSGTFLGAEGRGMGGEEGGGRVEALDALLSQCVIPHDVLRLLVLLSPHSGSPLASQKNREEEEERLVNYDAGLRKLLTGFVPCSKEHLSVATSSCRVLDLYGQEDDKEAENKLPGGDSSGMAMLPPSLGGNNMKANKFFSESGDRVQSELHSTTTSRDRRREKKEEGEEEEMETPLLSSKLLSVGAQGKYLVPQPFRSDPFDRDQGSSSLVHVDESKPAYFAGVLERFPVQKSSQEKLLELQVKMSSEGRVKPVVVGEEQQRPQQAISDNTFLIAERVVEMMTQGWLASEIDLGEIPMHHPARQQKQSGAQSKVDFELVKDLISVLRGFLHAIPKLSQSRLCWADYVSSQSYFMEFVKVGVAHHNLKCLVQSLQGGFDEGTAACEDQMTQAFAKSMETILLVIDGEVSRIQASSRTSDELKGEADYSFMTLSVSELFEMTQVLRSQVVAIASLCGCFPSFEAIRKNPRLLQTQWQLSKLPKGKDLLNYLHDNCIHTDGPEQQVLNYLFQNTLKPFVQQIHESVFQHLKIEKDTFVDDFSSFLDAIEGRNVNDDANNDSSGFGLPLPSFLQEWSDKIQMSFFQYNILKEFDHCIPLLSFMEKLSAYHWSIKGSSLSSPSSSAREDSSFVQRNLEGHGTGLTTASGGVSQILTLDADQLESTRDHYKTVSSVADNAIKSMLDYLAQKRTFQRVASQTASKAKLLTEERTISKQEQEETLRSLMKKKEQLKLAEELKSAATIYQAAKVAAENAEREADRLRLVDESQRRSAVIQEASAILKEEAALRMKRVQKEIDRLNWRRRRLGGDSDLQPKRLFDIGGSDAPTSSPSPAPSIPATPECEEELHDDSEEVASGEKDATEVLVEDDGDAPTASMESKDRGESVREGETDGSGEDSSSRQSINGAVSPLEKRQEMKMMASSLELGATKNGEAELETNERTRVAGGDTPDKALVSTTATEEALKVALKEPGKNGIFDAPLPEAIYVCIVQQIELNYSCISKLCVRYFLEELNLLESFSLMRQFYLLEAGDFGHSFLSHIVEKGLLDDSARLFEKDVTAAFDIAVQNMSYSSPLVNSFGIQFIEQEAALLVGGNIHVLDCIELKYKASFPFSLFFNGEAEKKYQKLFSFFLCLRRSGFVLNEIWHFILGLQRDLRRKDNDEESAIQEEILAMLQGSHHEMSHLLTMLESYICTNIHSNLTLGFQSELMDPKLTESGNIGEIHQLHQQFLSKCLDCCFLSPRHQPVLNIVYTALQTILDVQTLLHAEEEVELWDLQSHLVRAQARFRNATKSLFQILKHKGMEEVLVQFDFNSFYENQ